MTAKRTGAARVRAVNAEASSADPPAIAIVGSEVGMTPEVAAALRELIAIGRRARMGNA